MTKITTSNRKQLMVFSESFGELTTTFVRSELDYFLNSGIDIQYVAQKNAGVEFLRSNFNLNILQLKEFKLISLVRIKLKLNFNRFLNYNREFSKKLNTLVSSYKPEALYFHFFNEFLFYYDNLSTENQNLPITIHFHGYDASRLLIYDSYLKRIRSISNKSNVRFVFVSSDMKHRLEQKIGKILNGSVLYYGINKHVFNSITFPSTSRNLILYVQISSFDERKGHAFSLTSFSKFIKKQKNPGLYKFLIAGSGTKDQQKRILSLIKDLDIGNHVELLGPLNPIEIRDLLMSADYFVHNSVTHNHDMEGIPITIMEAMSMGLPVLTTNHSGIPELVINDKSGIVIEENNVFECETAFEKMLKFKKPNLYNVQRMKNEFNFDTYCDKLKEFIFNTY